MMDSRTRLRFEQLEEKKLLAGDVAVSVVGGALIVEGDELGNQVAISSGESPGEYVIAGLGDTSVHLEGDDALEAEENGNQVVVSGVRRGVHVSTHEGDDTVIVEDARIRENVTIHTGAGEDHVRIGPAPPPADAIELEEDGEGQVGSANVAIGRSLLIRTGSENDSVLLGGRPVPLQDVPVVEEEGGRPAIAPSVVVRGHTFVGLGEGEDSLAVDAVHGRWGLSANGGLGEDDIQVANSRFMFLGLRGGSGEFTDTVGLHHVHARSAVVVTGAGEDSVDITDSAFGMLGAHLGDGDDTLTIARTSARLAVLLGGAGEGDLWNDEGDNEFGRQIVRGFEFPEPVADDDEEE